MLELLFKDDTLWPEIGEKFVAAKLDASLTSISPGCSPATSAAVHQSLTIPQLT